MLEGKRLFSKTLNDDPTRRLLLRVLTDLYLTSFTVAGELGYIVASIYFIGPKPVDNDATYQNGYKKGQEKYREALKQRAEQGQE